MSKLKILVLVGGISGGSINKQLFGEVKRLTADKFEFDELDISAIPYYSQDLEADLPPAVRDLKTRIEACDGVLFVTPEYNRSIPGVLKNAIDWGSRPYGSNSWKGKPAAMMGTTPGAIGTFGAQCHLRQILSEIAVCVMPVPHFYHSAGEGGGRADEKTAERIKKVMDALAAWVQKISK